MAINKSNPPNVGSNDLVGRSEPEPADARGPGQPRIHADNAAKQRAYRTRRADGERRNLVAWILKKSRSVLNGREYRRKLHTELITLAVADLRTAVEVLKKNLDTHGRLHNERSGEHKRLNGMSEIERLLARREQRGNGHQVSVKTPSILKAPQGDEALSAAIRDLVNEISVDRRCPWCDAKFDAKFDARTAAENHLNEEYDKGQRQANHVKTLRDSGFVPADILEEAERRLSEQTHYLRINERVRCLRKRHGQWQSEGKRVLDSSKTYVEWDLRVW